MEGVRGRLTLGKQWDELAATDRRSSQERKRLHYADANQRARPFASRTSGATKSAGDAASRREVAITIRGEQERRAADEVATPGHPFGGCSNIGTICTSSVLPVPVQVPLINVPSQVELTPEPGPKCAVPHRSDVRHAALACGAFPRAIRIFAPIDSVLVRRPWIRRSPWILPLLTSTSSRELPFRFAGQKSSVPDAKSVSLVPVHVVHGQVLLAASRGRPRRGGALGDQVCVRRRDVAVVRRNPPRLSPHPTLPTSIIPHNDVSPANAASFMGRPPLVRLSRLPWSCRGGLWSFV
jgi:hypothetical protein